MTEREFRLRRRIDTLTDERDRALAYGNGARTKARPSWCVYCGVPVMTRGWPTICFGHADLLKLDPFYSEAA